MPLRKARPDGLSNDADRLRLSVLALTEFIAERFAFDRPRSVVRECGDVHEQLGSAMRRCNEAETSVFVPRSQNASESHARVRWWLNISEIEVRLGVRK